MALRNITLPTAALLFTLALACAPVMAAPAGSQSGSGGGGNSHSSGGGGASHSGGGGHGGHHFGGTGFHRYGGGAHFAGHRSSRRFHRSHGNGVFFFGFGAPYPYYYGNNSYVVCRYRRVRYHGRWVRRRYCWRQYR